MLEFELVIKIIGCESVADIGELVDFRYGVGSKDPRILKNVVLLLFFALDNENACFMTI